MNKTLFLTTILPTLVNATAPGNAFNQPGVLYDSIPIEGRSAFFPLEWPMISEINLNIQNGFYVNRTLRNPSRAPCYHRPKQQD